MIRLQTVDVWDTLLRRRCHPDAVKLHLAGWLLARHWPEIAPALRSPRALLARRFDAERELARAARSDPVRDDEYQHRDVLRLWAGAALVARAVDAALLDALEAEEFAQELRVGYADPAIASVLAARPRQRTLFLSDFYMRADRLEALLAARGLDALVEGGHSSCEIGLNKRSGRLYRAVQALHGVAAEEHVHLGDNPETDLRVPRRLGIAAERYRNRAEERRQAFNRRVLGDRARLFATLRRRALAELAMPADREAGRAFRYGIETAPLFAGFALFLLEVASRERLAQLWFLGREGAFFANIYSVLRTAGAAPGGIAPEGRRLAISRRASFAASLQGSLIDDLQRLWRGHEPVTMRTFALSLSLDAAQVEAWCRRHALGFDEPLAQPADEPRLCALLADEECRDALTQHTAAQATLLRDHLAEHGLRDAPQTVGVVDIGWRGTIQDNLALLLPRVRFSGCYLGLQRYLNPQPANAAKRAYGPDLNRDPKHATLFRRLPLIELLCTPAQGGVTGYARAADGSIEVLRTDDESHTHPLWRRAIEPFQAGVMQALPIWADALCNHAVDSGELRGEALARWQHLIERPPAIIERARALLPHDERFGRGQHQPPDPPRRSWPQSWLRRRG